MLEEIKRPGETLRFIKKNNASSQGELNLPKLSTLKTLLNHNLRFNASENNLKTLGNIYVQKANSIYLARVNNGDSNIDEKEKINGLCQHIYEMCTTSKIQKLVDTAQYSTLFINEVELNALSINNNSQENVETVQDNLPQFADMTVIDKMKFLCDMFGEEGKFDFSHHKIPKRYQPFMRSVKNKLSLNLLPMATYKEREMLICIGKCQNKDDIDDLR